MRPLKLAALFLFLLTWSALPWATELSQPLILVAKPELSHPMYGKAVLVVKPFEKRLIKEIEKAIVEANLGFNPMSDGDFIRVPMPPLSTERRKEYVKILHKQAEEARVAIRQVRKDANDEIKKSQKDSGKSEDDARREQEETQKLTDRYIHQVDELLKHKEAEVMEV